MATKKPRPLGDGVFKWSPVAVVKKYDNSGKLYETVRAEGNGLTDAGVARLTALLIGDPVVALDSSHVRIGVGDSTSAFSPSDTNLGSSQFYQVMSPGFPDIDGSVVTWKCEFADAEANFSWECWGLDVDASGGVSAGATPIELFNRRVFNFGIKTGGTWSLAVTINITQPTSS